MAPARSTAPQPDPVGEAFLLVPTRKDHWRNRRVTLRRFDDFIR